MTAVPPPGPHGGDGVAVARALGLDPAAVLDLSQSLNPFAPDAAALVAGHLDAVHHYPGAAATARATAALAEAMGVDVERLVLTNGGSEAITLVAGARGGGVAAEPEFALHPRGSTGPRWRSNPHNPTGVLAGVHEQVDVWDEAFYPLATGEWTRGDAAVVVGSLTKLFACPGLRLGYVLADDVGVLTAGQPAWPVNGLALAVLPDLLAAADLPGWCTAIAERRHELARLLAGHGLAVAAGDAPWVLVQAPGLRERLAPRGVVVRDCASFGLAGWARVAVPDDDGLARLDAALTSSTAPLPRAGTAPSDGGPSPAGRRTTGLVGPPGRTAVPGAPDGGAGDGGPSPAGSPVPGGGGPSSAGRRTTGLVDPPGHTAVPGAPDGAPSDGGPSPAGSPADGRTTGLVDPPGRTAVPGAPDGGPGHPDPPPAAAPQEQP